MCNKNFPYTKHGLSLVEVLLAVSILAIGIVGVLRAYASSITAMEAGQYNIQAESFLKTKMSELELSLKEKEKIAPESGSGVFKSPFQDLSWQWKVSSTDEENLYRLALTVSGDENPRKFFLTTYVADRVEDEKE